jgi:hypothetical protein
MSKSYIETIDYTKLAILVSNLDSLAEQVGLAFNPSTCKRTDYEGTKTVLKKYLDSKDPSTGSSTIKYTFSKSSNKGRLFSKTPSLQGLPRSVRHTIANENMLDIDIKSCHPTILKWYAKNHNLELGNLDYYLDHREKCHNQLMAAYKIDKDDAKCIVLSIINGGMPKELTAGPGGPAGVYGNGPKWLIALYNEIQVAHEFIVKNEPVFHAEVIKSKGNEYYNINGSVCNKMFCYYENMILNHMMDVCDTFQVEIGALCFDGLMVYKTSVKDLPELLSSMETCIHEKMGIELNIVQKNMDEIIDLTGFPTEPAGGVREQSQVVVCTDDYYWVDFVYDARKVFDSLEDLVEFFKTNFPKVCKKVCIGNGFYLKKEYSELLYNNTSMKELDRTTKFYYNVTNTQSGGKMVNKKITMNLGDLFEMSHLDVYSHVVCHPLDISSKVLNTWVPLKADIVRSCNFNKVKPLLEFIKDIISNNNEEMYKYIMTWIRQVCITPQNKTGKVLVFQSGQGSGKGSLVDWMTKYLFGGVSATNMTIDSLTSKFNGKLMNKVFISVDELPVTSERFHSVFDTLKNQITSHMMEIQYKGREPFDTTNLLNFIFMTNHENSVKVESGDRRYVIFKISGSKIGDHAYWSKMHKEVFTEDMAIEFFNYLREMKEDELVDLNVIPTTELRSRMIENSMNSVEMFIKLVRDRELEEDLVLLSSPDDVTPLISIPPSSLIKIKKNNLYSVYVKWCADVGEKVHKQKMFNQYLTEGKSGAVRFWIV